MTFLTSTSCHTNQLQKQLGIQEHPKVQAMALKPSHLPGGIPHESKLGQHHVCGLIRSRRPFNLGERQGETWYSRNEVSQGSRRKKWGPGWCRTWQHVGTRETALSELTYRCLRHWRSPASSGHQTRSLRTGIGPSFRPPVPNLMVPDLRNLPLGTSSVHRYGSVSAASNWRRKRQLWLVALCACQGPISPHVSILPIPSCQLYQVGPGHQRGPLPFPSSHKKVKRARI